MTRDELIALAEQVESDFVAIAKNASDTGDNPAVLMRQAASDWAVIAAYLRDMAGRLSDASA